MQDSWTGSESPGTVRYSPETVLQVNCKVAASLKVALRLQVPSRSAERVCAFQSSVGPGPCRGQVLSLRGALTVQQTLLVCKKPPGQRTRPPHLLGPFTHLQGSVSFWVLHSEEEEESVLQMACGWSGGLCWCSPVFSAGRGPLVWSPWGL